MPALSSPPASAAILSVRPVGAPSPGCLRKGLSLGKMFPEHLPWAERWAWGTTFAGVCGTKGCESQSILCSGRECHSRRALVAGT